ncbi:replication initiation protein, partial [Escherichia coli]|nr:replication initiation protein [Escherichia coli]
SHGSPEDHKMRADKVREIAAKLGAAAIERSLCEKLCADVNYSGLICKNPFHLEWQVMEWREEAYTLDELADYLDLSASA